VRLQPANESLKPIYADPRNVAIQGKVIGVIRKLG
jgi:SOS-response transcriptional repressor LexA